MNIRFFVCSFCLLVILLCCRCSFFFVFVFYSVVWFGEAIIFPVFLCFFSLASFLFQVSQIFRQVPLPTAPAGRGRSIDVGGVDDTAETARDQGMRLRQPLSCVPAPALKHGWEGEGGAGVVSWGRVAVQVVDTFGVKTVGKNVWYN